MMEKGKKFISFITGYWTHIFCLSLIVIGMPFSKFLMSLGTIALVVNWVLEGGIIIKSKKFLNNRIALFSTGLYLIFVIGLIHTQDFEYGIKDLRIKLPLLIFPIIFSSTHRIKKNHYFLIVKLFVWAVTISSLYGFLAYNEILPAKKEILQIRDASQFISHIRLSMMIVLCIFLLPKLFNSNMLNKGFGLIVFFWFIFYLVFIESASGLVLGVTTTFVVSTYYLFKKKSSYGYLLIMPILAGVVIVSYSLYSTYNNVKMDVSNLETKTALGNLYEVDYGYSFFDNGNFSHNYVAENELQEAWEKRSEFPFNGNEKVKGVKFILIRYLTSKGLRKDQSGVNSLSKQDVLNVEQGIPNYLQFNQNMLSRLKILMFETDGYLQGASSNGNSLAQRLEYWNYSVEIIKEKPVFGHGSGDVNACFLNQYSMAKNTISKLYQRRSHNQYLSTAIALGIVGLIFFLIFILYPVSSELKNRNYFYLICLFISLISFFSEDTLETQNGVFFVAFLCNFFLFSSMNRYEKSV